MTNQLLWMIAKLLIILIHCTYKHENTYSSYSRRLNNIDNHLTLIRSEIDS